MFVVSDVLLAVNNVIAVIKFHCVRKKSSPMAEFDLPRMQSLAPDQEPLSIAYSHRPMVNQHQVMYPIAVLNVSHLR
uniref:Uncharacterized protein n=1 Tax=Anopheles minimus TaxID=112268 RepID=A0A182WK34_9DIPT